MAVLRGDWLTQGPTVPRFEARLAQLAGVGQAVVCSSGTAALHLAMIAAGVGPGDELVVPANTFVATAAAGVSLGAKARFADVDAVTGNVRVTDIECCLNRATKAVLPVHFAGYPCDMRAVRQLVRAAAPKARVIEDACHALGAQHADGTPVGWTANSDMVVFSFHPVKHVAMGEGGVVLTDDADLADTMRRARCHGLTKDRTKLRRPDEGPWYYEMHEPGHNYRATDIACALGLAQLEKLDRSVARRRHIAARYHTELAGLQHTVLPSPFEVARSSWHIYVLHIDFAALGKSRRRVVEELAARNVGTQVHYYPVPLQPYYRDRLGHTEGDFPGAEQHYARALTIPLFPGLSDGDVDVVVASLHEVIQ